MLKAACILLLIGLAASDSLSSISSVVSRILDQAKGTRSRPVILVINSKALQDSSSSVELPSYRQSSEENGLENGFSMLSVLSQLQKSRPKPSQYRARPRPQSRKPKRMPVYKSLLSLRNSLRCGARDECIDECTELPKKKQDKCDRKCEKKYQCEEEEQCDDCDEGGSTKGPPASEEKPKGCTRC